MEGTLPFTNADRMLVGLGWLRRTSKQKTTIRKRNVIMNTITKSLMYVQLAGLCLATAFADPNLKQKDFEGSISSVETQTFEGTTMFVHGSGTGQGTHLGQFTYTYEFVVDLLTGIGVGSAEFTAANGDSFFTLITAFGDPAGHVVEEHTIVGGTGRFAGASGSFTLDRLVTWTSDTTNESVGMVDGTIVIPK
jgi:hypothetical protein